MTARWDETVDALDAADLVGRAAEGDGWAWERLVDRYERLIWAVTRDFKLIESDAADVTQVTWLRLLEHIHRLDQPGRVGSWLATTARRECLRNLAARKKTVLASDDDAFEQTTGHGPEVDEPLLAAERAQEIRDALSCLPPRWQQLLHMLMADPPVPYTQISSQLGLPIGSIGPTRARCLAKLRSLLQPADHRQLQPGQPTRDCLPDRQQEVIPFPSAKGQSRGCQPDSGSYTV